MNWDANLAAIIKHTDANLQQQFRQFEELGALPVPYDIPSGAFAGRSGAPQQQQAEAASNNFANAYLRDTMASLRGGSGSSGLSVAPGGFADPSTPAPSSFAQHFREQQDRKKQHHEYEHQRTAISSDDGGSEYDDGNYDPQPQYYQQQQPSRPRRSRHVPKNNNNAGLGAHMYASPTYDMAQMMEQVRLSLKLEVDARAAIAERQLSALLQLCKASSEELDRLRIEVCAADRQLHTLDQVQAKMRQELTTQKDIGFHLQSMCGKDESWRMQAENQLLEMRQLVAAIREQGNAVQMQVQDKLSRQELLVQFNAAIEPIKAQFQATLQHQAHQLAEITRSSSSSTLVLDALTQKLNRVQGDEVVALRNELQALKVHVSRMGAIHGRGDGGRVDGESGGSDHEGDGDSHTDSGERLQRTKSVRRATSSQAAREKAVAQARERERLKADRRQQREAALKKELVDVLIPQTALPLIKHELETSVKPQITDVRASLDREVAPLKQELQSLARVVQENWTACQRQVSATATTVETTVRNAEQQLRGELATQAREMRDKQDQLSAQAGALVETRVAVIHAKHNDVVKMMETEHNDRKAANDLLQEELRRARHGWEEQLHVLSCEHRTKATSMGDEWSQKLREMERKWTELVETAARQSASHIETVCTKTRADVETRVSDVEAVAKTSVETIAQLEKAVIAIAQDAAALGAKIKTRESDERQPEEQDPLPPGVLTRRASVTAAVSEAATAVTTATQGQLASIDSLLQKMMLQMQLQMQQQQQLVLAHTSAVPPNMMYTPPPYAHWPAMVHPNMPAPLQAPPMAASATPVSAPSSVAVDITASAAAATRQDIDRTKPTDGVATVENVPLPSKKPVDTVEQKPSKPVQLPPDPCIDEIISRAVAEELASPAKPQASRLASSSPPSPPTDTASSTSSSKSAPSPVSSSPSPSSFATPSAPTSSAAASDRRPATPATSPSPTETTIETPVDSIAVQQTLASTVKGATTEAEMAKQRIEARRKQDQEARLQATTASPLPPMPPLARASSTSSLLSLAETTKPTDNANAVMTTPAIPTLPRSHSVSNLTQPVPSSPATKQPSVTQAPTATAKPAPPPSSTSIPRPTLAVSESKPVAMPPLASAPPPPADVAKPKPSGDPPPPPPAAAQSLPQHQHQPITHVLCDQCRLPVRSDLLSEHMQRQCIKRTVGCTKCLAKVPWREVDAHKRDCQGVSAATPTVPPPPPRPTAPSPPATTASDQADSATEALAATQLKKCRHCAYDVASTELFDHELKCDQMLKQCPHCLRRQKLSELQDHIDSCDCRLVSCPNDCGGKFLQRGLDKHLTTRCPKRSASNVTPHVPASPSGAGPETAPPPPPLPPSALSRPLTAPAAVSAVPPPATKAGETGKLEKVECKFCDEEFSAREIDTHENNCDWKPRRCQHCNMVIISRDLARHESSCKTSTKNCPHCNDTMAQSALQAHTSRCSKRPIKCIRCCQLFPADSIVSHSSSCKFIPSVTASSTSFSSSSTSTTAPATAGTSTGGATASVRIPPPPPYPPTPVLMSTAATTGSMTRPGGASTSTTVTTSAVAAVVAARPSSTGGDESAGDRIARRNLALSQLTNQPIAAPGGQHPTGNATRPSPATVAHPEVDDDDHMIDDEEDDEEDEKEEDEEEEDEDHLTLAQVVAEWSVENVCLWLHEDVGVPDVVPRFQQRRCNGEMLLELTESDLINDYGIKNRIHRERILSAIDAIKTSDDFSDEEEEEEEQEEEEEEDDDGGEDEMATRTQLLQQRASVSRLSLSDASSPRDLLRRNSLPSPQQSPVRIAGGPLSNASALPSSSAMLRRINSALNVEFPATTSRPNK